MAQFLKGNNSDSLLSLSKTGHLAQWQIKYKVLGSIPSTEKKEGKYVCNLFIDSK